MTELKPLETLALFETNKEQRLSFAKNIVDAVENGQINPLDTHLQLKGMEDILKSITDKSPKTNKNHELAEKYNQALMAEAELNGKSFERHSAKFSIGEVGTKYDYSVCNDPVINNLLAEQETIKQKVEFRQNELKSAPISGRNEVDPDTGEMITVYPPKKTSTTSLKVTLK